MLEVGRIAVQRRQVQLEILHVRLNARLQLLENGPLKLLDAVFRAEGRAAQRAVGVLFCFDNRRIELFFVDSFDRAILRFNLVVPLSFQKQLPWSDLEFAFILAQLPRNLEES